MKKQISTIVLLLLCNILNAQILEWRLAGNTGTTPGTDYFGTTDAKSVVFKTSATERDEVTIHWRTWNRRYITIRMVTS
ncbi:MAG: hypothetical protein IPK10_04740 [Bacteroidetes bacterium]|nr:hypothetical protein [Bacteroidota bacterium]